MPEVCEALGTTEMNLKDFSVELLDKSVRVDYNTIKLGNNESKNHKLAKMKVCEMLVKAERPFLTECKLKGYGRVDVIAPLSQEIFECLESETQVKFEQKSFPVGWTVCRVVYDKAINDIRVEVGK